MKKAHSACILSLCCLFCFFGIFTSIQGQVIHFQTSPISPQGPARNGQKWTPEDRLSDLDYYLDPNVLNRDELIDVVRNACETAKMSLKVPTESQLRSARMKLRQTVDSLDRTLKGYHDQEKAKTWRESLGLQEMQQELRRQQDFSSAPLGRTLQTVLDSPFQNEQILFGPITNELRQYLTLEYAVVNTNRDFVELFRQICDDIPVFVEKYLDGDKPEYGPPLAESLRWLSDLSVHSQECRQLVSVLKQLLARPNCFFSASIAFLNGGFQQGYEEDIDVRENIFGTMVTGKGQVQSETRGTLRPNSRSGELQIQIDSVLQTETVGRQHRVRVLSESTGLLTTYKSLFFSLEGISSGQTRSKGNMYYTTKRVDINTCPMVQPIIRNEVQRRRPMTEREATRRAEVQTNRRVDARVDERIKELNEQFQEKIRQPLLQSGYFPTLGQFYTSETKLSGLLLIGDSSQLSTATLPPDKPVEADVSLQLHQSALTNSCSFAFSGQRIEEKQLLEQLQERFPNLAKKWKQDSEQDNETPPLTITFAKKSPLSFIFLDQCMSIIIHADRFEQEGREYPGLDITIKYNVQTETVKENGQPVNRVLLELAESPSVFPPGFNPNSGEKIAGRSQIIRGIITRRLDKALKKSWELEPIEPGGQWQEQGTLKPLSANCENGWFSLAWTWDAQP